MNHTLAIDSILLWRHKLNKERNALKRERKQHANTDMMEDRLRVISLELRRLKSRLYYHRLRGKTLTDLQSQRRRLAYHKRRVRYLSGQLQQLTNLPSHQLVNLSTTAGQLRARVESKIASHVRCVSRLQGAHGTPTRRMDGSAHEEDKDNMKE